MDWKCAYYSHSFAPGTGHTACNRSVSLRGARREAHRPRLLHQTQSSGTLFVQQPIDACPTG